MPCRSLGGMVLCSKYTVFCVGIYLAYIVCALSGAYCEIFLCWYQVVLYVVSLAV